MADQEVDKQQRLIAAYKVAFATEQGKILYDVLSEFSLDKNYLPDIFDAQSSHRTAFNLGANKVMRYIKYMLKRKTEKKQEQVIS